MVETLGGAMCVDESGVDMLAACRRARRKVEEEGCGPRAFMGAVGARHYAEYREVGAFVGESSVL